MGSKINLFKKHSLIVIAFAIFLILFLPNVNSGAQNINPLVKVAISNNNFKTMVYNNLSIIATSEFTLYDKQTAMPLATFLPQDVVRVVYKNGKFEIFSNEKSVLKNVEGNLIFNCPNGILGVDGLKRRGKQALYHGIFEIAPKDELYFYLVNILDLQEYLKGVVPNEMPVRFGLEALKAQAIAARNYVLMSKNNSKKAFDVDDSVASQVYFGANTEHPLATEAVVETQGLVATYNSNLILAQYCSTAGGYTESWNNAFPDAKLRRYYIANPKPYLKGRPDIISTEPLNDEESARKFYMSTPESYDMKSPYYRWTKEYTFDELNETLPKMLVAQSKTGFIFPEFKQGDDFGELKEINVLKRGVSGKIMDVEIVTDKGRWKAEKELVIRRLFPKNGISLPSANVVFDITRDTNGKILTVKAYGGGFGHGVGMSQFGAGFMANDLHKSFDKILKRYYTGIAISTIPVSLCADEGQNVLHTQFYAPYKKAKLIVENPCHVKNFGVKINNVDVQFEMEQSPFFNKANIIDITEYIKKGKNDVVYTLPLEEKNKSIKVYVELVEKDDSEYSF